MPFLGKIFIKNMGYKIIIASEKIWLKDMSFLHPKELKSVQQKIKILEQEPWPEELQVKKLKHYALAGFRLRVGDYRVLFDRNLETKTILIFRVLHRSKLY
jgi:mRNA interferase RelE/StbE